LGTFASLAPTRELAAQQHPRTGRSHRARKPAARSSSTTRHHHAPHLPLPHHAQRGQAPSPAAAAAAKRVGGGAAAGGGGGLWLVGRKWLLFVLFKKICLYWFFLYLTPTP